MATEHEYDLGDEIVLTAVFTTRATAGSIDVGASAMSVASAAGYNENDPLVVAGAGPEGSNLFTTVASISGTTLELDDPAATRVIGTFVGKLADPSEVVCYVEVDGESTEADVTSSSTGTYTASFSPDTHGEHAYRFQGTGTLNGAEEGSFFVREQRAMAPVVGP